MIWSLKNFMNKRSAEWMVAVTAYLPTGIFWWVICSLPFVMFAAFRFSPSSPPPFLVYTPDSARSQLVKLAAYTLFLGILGSLAVMVSLEVSGKSSKKILSRMLPIAIGIAMGLSQANALNAPWWYGALLARMGVSVLDDSGSSPHAQTVIATVP